MKFREHGLKRSVARMDHGVISREDFHDHGVLVENALGVGRHLIVAFTQRSPCAFQIAAVDNAQKNA